jgi:isoamylase
MLRDQSIGQLEVEVTDAHGRIVSQPSYTLAVLLTPGHASPLGATYDGRGTNFAVWSSCATRVELCLFESPNDAAETVRVFLPGRTGNVWHGYAEGVRPGQLYGFRVHGPWDPERGHRCNAAELLFDPYARAVGRAHSWEPEQPPLGMVVDNRFAWGADRPLRTPLSDTVIYELHVKGFTALHPYVPAGDRGTFRGLASDAALAHLKRLGVTAVELMPIHFHVDERALYERGLTNYWGYNTLGYFAPDPRFAAIGNPLYAVDEFKSMVKTLHAAGIEVILDVVYNHTAEGDHLGPTLSMKGIDNACYYRLRKDDLSRYQDFTGCGNTLDTRSAVVRELILDSLRYWVTEMHVDGFRFDLASALVRIDHHVDLASPLLRAIGEDPVLAGVKLIAEPWDATGDGYLLGGFPAGWSEWNGRYRDTVRRAWRGDSDQRAELATRLSGSSDLFGGGGRSPHASINFITAHDGFTLADVVSYAHKHNEANGEANADGELHNNSANWGEEGPTADPAILETRARVTRSLLLTLCVSQGVPMLGGGDELGRTQHGNNNPYCHDSPVTWTRWPGDESLRVFTERALALRRAHPQLRRASFFNGGTDITWVGRTGQELTEADWHDGDERVLGMWLRDDAGRSCLFVAINPGASDVMFQLPELEADTAWSVALSSADDATPSMPPDSTGAAVVPAHTVAVFERSPPSPGSRYAPGSGEASP